MAAAGGGCGGRLGGWSTVCCAVFAMATMDSRYVQISDLNRAAARRRKQNERGRRWNDHKSANTILYFLCREQIFMCINVPVSQRSVHRHNSRIILYPHSRAFQYLTHDNFWYISACSVIFPPSNASLTRQEPDCMSPSGVGSPDELYPSLAVLVYRPAYRRCLLHVPVIMTCR